MTFTALHRHLGRPSGPITEDMIDQAVAGGFMETDDLDWKSELPARKDLRNHDFVKDVAAMANSGGGVIVFGVEEVGKAATSRCHAGDFDEAFERSIGQATIGAITPPVFGVRCHVVGDADNLAVVVEIPPSQETPHLVYRNEYFGAPRRNGPDTVWMKERQVEAAYRSRFDARRHAGEALRAMLDEAAIEGAPQDVAYLIAAAEPLHGRVGEQPSRDVARKVFSLAKHKSDRFAGDHGRHPLGWLDAANPRRGFRSWVADGAARRTAGESAPALAWVYDNGATAVSFPIGAQQMSDRGWLLPWEIKSESLEAAIGDFVAVVRQMAELSGCQEYELTIEVHWHGDEPLQFVQDDRFGLRRYEGRPFKRFRPVTRTIKALGDIDALAEDVGDLALSCLNQGGLEERTNVGKAGGS